MARNYSSIAPEKTLSGNVTVSAVQITLNSLTGLPDAPYTLVINPDTSIEEIVLVNSIDSGTTLNVSRAQEGTVAQPHTSGQKVRHQITALDLQDAQDHIAATEDVHGISDTANLVYLNSTQTLLNKTLTSPKINENVLVTATSTEINVLDGIGASTAELNIMDGVTASTAEINTLDGITASTAELNILDGATLTTTELNYVDGVTSAIQTQFNALEAFPKGLVSPFAGSSAPTGWLLCDGSAVSRTTYSGLFAVVSTTYGAGDTSTTFNVPDLRGRTVIGVGTGTGLTARSLAATGGAETVTLEIANMPAHDHGGVSGGMSANATHSHGGTLVSGSTYRLTAASTGAHTHDISGSTTNGNDHDHGTAVTSTYAETAAQGIGETNAGASAATLTNAAQSDGAHAHNVDYTATSVAHTHTITSQGSGTAVANMQPFIALNYIIKH